jgi:hypothetical protein
MVHQTGHRAPLFVRRKKSANAWKRNPEEKTLNKREIASGTRTFHKREKNEKQVMYCVGVGREMRSVCCIACKKCWRSTLLDSQWPVYDNQKLGGGLFADCSKGDHSEISRDLDRL